MCCAREKQCVLRITLQRRRRTLHTCPKTPFKPPRPSTCRVPSLRCPAVDRQCKQNPGAAQNLRFGAVQNTCFGARGFCSFSVARRQPLRLSDPCLANGMNTCSQAPAQHCIHASPSQMVSAIAQRHLSAHQKHTSR